MAGNFNVSFNGNAATNIKTYDYSQSNLTHNAGTTRMNTETEIDYGEVEEFDYNAYLANNQSQPSNPQPPQNDNPLGLSKEEIRKVREELEGYGFTRKDINRLLRGEISLEDLYKEIENDTNGTRRRKIYEANYLSSLGSEFNSISDLKSDIRRTKREIQALTKKMYEFDMTEEEAAYGIAMALAMYGGDLDEIVDNYIVGWAYEDADGVTRYEYCYNPNYMGGFYEATPIYYNDVFPDSKYLEQIRNSLVETTRKRGWIWAQEEYTTYEWQGTEEQLALANFLEAKKDEAIANRENKYAEYQAQIDSLTTRKLQEEAILEYIDQELDHYMANVDAYIHKPNFLDKSGMNAELRERAEEINASTKDNIYSYDETLPSKVVSGKENGMAVIAAIVNKTGDFYCTSGMIFATESYTQITFSDSKLKNYTSWIPFMQEDEIQVFNYIYNTEGVDAAYDYLVKISDELDSRWLMDRQQKDAEWAKEHPFLASAASVVITPFEGMNAAINSLGSVLTGNEIRRVEVYSSGDVFRQAVSQDIYEHHGEVASFFYNTGMSMADSGLLIAGTVATGGLMGAAGVTGGAATVAVNGVISATTMGSRAYVSTLNDALDRGLNDGTAVTLAFSSAAVETLMESYSVGHLMNLEGALGDASTNLLRRVTASISDPTLQKIVLNSGYIALGAISQGLCEGEEELCTEIFNHYLDEMIAGDLSNYNISIKNHMMEGLSEEEARRLATEEYHDQIQQAFLGGMVSGGVFGGAQTTYQTYSYSNRIAQSINTEYRVNGLTDIEQTMRNQIMASILGIDGRYQDVCIAGLTGNLTQEQVTAAGLGGLVALKEAVENYQRYDSTMTLENIFKNVSDGEIDTKVIERFFPSEEQVANSSFENIQMNSLDVSFDGSISALVENLSDFESVFNYIMGLDDRSVPSGYGSAEEYRKAFIRTLIDSGKINEITNGNVFALVQDQVMLDELVGTDKLNDLFVKNLERLYGTILPIFSNLNDQQWNTLFGNDTMKNFLSGLKPEILGKIIAKFDGKFSSSWLSIESLVDIVSNMSVDEFNEFVKNIGYSKDNLKLFLQSELGKANYSKLLDAIINKFYTKDVILKDNDYQGKVDNLIISFYELMGVENTSEISNKLNTITTIKDDVKSTLENALKENSEVKLTEKKFGGLVIDVDSSYEYHDLIYEIDGKEYTMTQKLSYSGSTIDLFSFTTHNDLRAALVEGRLTIKRVVPNMVRSTLYLTEQNGVQKGLNEIRLLVDGKEEHIIANLTNSSVDLYYDFKSAKSVEILSINPIGSLNVEVEDVNAVYKIIYEIDGVQHETYQTVSEMKSSREMAENVLEIDKFIEQKNLIGVKIVSVSIASDIDIRNAFSNSYKASNDIYTSSKYGGNQSDVRIITQSFLEGESLSNIDTQKASILLGLIDKYFPNVTDIQKINLATMYEQGGCAYMAVANAFATYMGSIENGANIFNEMFGYDLVIKDGDITSYNVEAIAFDICLRYLSKNHQGDINSIDFKKSVGISAILFGEIIDEYFEEHGVEIASETSTRQRGHSLKSDLLTAIVEAKDSFHILSASEFDMELMSDINQTENSQDGALANSKTVGTVKKGVGGHAMLITDINESLDLIVSSWSRQYKFLADSIASYKTEGKSAHATIWNIKFSIPSNK